MVIGTLTKTHQVKRTQGAFLLLAHRQAVLQIEHRQNHVVNRRGAGQKVEPLENEPDLLVAQVGQLIPIQPRHIGAVQQIGPAGGPIQTAQRVHQGGFTRTAGSHQGDKLARHNFQRDAPHRMNIHLAGVVGLLYVLELDDGFHFGTLM